MFINALIFLLYIVAPHVLQGPPGLWKPKQCAQPEGCQLKVGLNEGRFAFDHSGNSYVNLRRGSPSMAMDKCHCLLLKVVLVSCVTPTLPWGKGKTRRETICSLGAFSV
jgi:hypothetical protein